MARFKKGMFLGSLIGAGLTWMTTTKKGKETREQLFDHAAIVFTDIQKQVGSSAAMKKLTKQAYVKKVREYVDKYAKDKDIADHMKEMIVKTVMTQWKNIKK